MSRSALVVVVGLLLSACTAAPVASGGTAPSATPAVSTADPSPEPVTLRRQDFQITYRLDGSTQASTAVGLTSQRKLMFVPEIAADSFVTAGQRVGSTVVDPSVRQILESGGAQSVDRSRLAQLVAMAGDVVAPVSGQLRLDGPVPAVIAPGIDVVAPLSPIQDLRYQSLRFTGDATVETVVGQRSVACAAIWIEASPQASQPPESGQDFSLLRCRLPGHIETAPGLRSQIVLRSELIPDAVVVPNILVGYDPSTDGWFLTVRQRGGQERLPVLVGATDGVVRLITSPVPLGAVLLRPEER